MYVIYINIYIYIYRSNTLCGKTGRNEQAANTSFPEGLQVNKQTNTCSLTEFHISSISCWFAKFQCSNHIDSGDEEQIYRRPALIQVFRHHMFCFLTQQYYMFVLFKKHRQWVILGGHCPRGVIPSIPSQYDGHPHGHPGPNYV